jgi:hypothetical protein
MHHPESDGIRPALVFPDQLAERVGITASGVFDELSLLWLHAAVSVTLSVRSTD